MNNKGIVFTIDALLSLLFIALLSLVFFLGVLSNSKDIEKIIINNQISDLLITTQHLEIKDIQELKDNYLLLFKERKGYLIIDNQKIEINNKNNYKTRIISQNIKYINSSNEEIYIEVGVYY